ncbi:MAG: exonuclease [Actinobacteria bacterium]|nr:MAG: exonuclease [Actinomycetota bacterium]
MTSDTWVAIDFETATASRDSACALGIAVIEDGAVAATASWLMRPPGNRYDPRNIGVHGITPSQTLLAPSYAELYGSIEPFLAGRHVLAHSASFDVSVLRAVHDHYRIPLPNTHYACSVALARRAFPYLHNHKLPTVCDHCGIELQHHDAASDAIACARIALNCRDAIGASSVHDAIAELGVRVRRL